MKGDYKGIMFAKFESKPERDRAARVLKEAGLREGGASVRAKADLPAERRAPHNFLFGLKHLLVDWGFNRSNLWIDTDTGTLKTDTELIVTAVVSNQNSN